MARLTQKNFKLPSYVYTMLDDYIKTMNQRGAMLRNNEICAAALLNFLESTEADQIEMVKKVRSYDLEVLAQTDHETVAAKAVVQRAARSQKTTPRGTRRRNKGGS